MASLESIRRRSGLLVGIIGLALLAFLMGDLLGSGGKILGGQQRILGEVNGTAIDQKQFEIELRNLSNASQSAKENTLLRQQLWNDKVNSIILGNEYEMTGLSVTPEELLAITAGYKGTEISDVARSIFGIQPGQEVSASDLSQSLIKLKNEDPARYSLIIDMIRKQYLNGKYNTLVQKSFQTTSNEAKEYFNQQGKTATGKYIYKNYSTVPEESISLTEADYLAYYNANLDDFKGENERMIKYAVFEINASAKDIEDSKNDFNTLMDEQIVFNEKFKVYDTISGFRSTTDMKGFLRENSDVVFNPAYFAKGQLSASIDDAMHSSEVGTVVGPFFEGDAFVAARLMDSRNDSVQVAIFTTDVLVSEVTSSALFSTAGKFAMNNSTDADFDAKIEEDQSIASFAMRLNTETTNITAVGEARQIVRWAFNTEREIGDINRFELADKFVVAMVSDKMEKGVRTLEASRAAIELMITQEKKKEILMSEFNTSKVASLEATAGVMGVSTVDFSSVPFSSSALTGVGYEPKVIGAMFSMNSGEMSEAISGSNGVFFLQVDSFEETPESNNYDGIKSQLQNAFQFRTSQVVPALKESSDIQDNRVDFF